MRKASRQTIALSRARERRQALDAHLAEQEQREDELTAAALVAWEELAEAERSCARATAALLDTGVTVERVAALLEQRPAEIRRLARRGAQSGPVDVAGRP